MTTELAYVSENISVTSNIADICTDMQVLIKQYSFNYGLVQNKYKTSTHVKLQK